MLEGFLRRDSDGRVRLDGCAYTRSTRGIILAEGENFVAIKWPGGRTEADGMGSREWVSPEISVYSKGTATRRSGEGAVRQEHIKRIIGWSTGRKAV